MRTTITISALLILFCLPGFCRDLRMNGTAHYAEPKSSFVFEMPGWECAINGAESRQTPGLNQFLFPGKSRAWASYWNADFHGQPSSELHLNDDVIDSFGMRVLDAGCAAQIGAGNDKRQLLLPGKNISPACNMTPQAQKHEHSGLILTLKEIFQSEGVPGKLVWLAEVESALDPQAESSAGAVGLFQLMPATAERFGVRLYPVDDRKEPEKSAKAAAAYLRYLKKEFGCWALALAAYNAGEGRVTRAMKAHNAGSFHEVAPHLPSETRRYVPRVMTTMALREDQARGVPGAFIRR